MLCSFNGKIVFEIGFIVFSINLFKYVLNWY
jgi:hypothetical protein